MMTEEIAKKRVDTLYQEGVGLANALAGDEEEKEVESFGFEYQGWYSRALPLIKQLAPDRYAEFQRYYCRDPKADLHWAHDRVIQDYLCELGKEDPIISRAQAVRCFTMQLAIFQSVGARLEWMALDTEDHVGRSLQLAELETARDLLKISERAAGALAGTVLQTFLVALANKHKLKFRKHAPSSRDYAEALKTANALDVPVWSQCTWLAEIHDRCLRPEGEAPTKTQVRDLIDGVHWLITNVF